MVDSYWRKIEDMKNGIENSIQISSILLKLREQDEKINDIELNENINSKIDTNEKHISSNKTKIDTNEKDISSNKTKIDTNEKDVSLNLKKIDNCTQYILKSGKDFEESYNIDKQVFRFDKDTHFYTIFEKEIEYDFTINSLLFVKNNMYYKCDNLSNDYHRLQHEYNIHDSEDTLIHRYIFNKDTYYDENLNNILHANEGFLQMF